MHPELTVGTKVVTTHLFGEQLYGIITAVDEPTLGPEFGATKYTVDWYLDGYPGVLSTDVLEAYERFEVYDWSDE